MKIEHQNTPHIHQNVMELLVQEEIERQLKYYPMSRKPYINRIEIATYALNRLPPLYASSQQGKQQQKRFGQVKYKEEITKMVRRAIAAIERDPLRASTPIISATEVKCQMADIALEKLQTLLTECNLIHEHHDISWDNVVSVVQRALNKVSEVQTGFEVIEMDNPEIHQGLNNPLLSLSVEGSAKTLEWTKGKPCGETLIDR